MSLRVPDIRGSTIVIDIGGTHVRIGHLTDSVLSPQGKTIGSELLRTTDPASVLSAVVKNYVSSSAITLERLVIGIPGVLDQQKVVISHCNNIPQMEGDNFAASLSRQLSCPVLLEQDIMLQLLGEWYGGSAQGSDAVFGLYFGTGIGSAYLRDGDPSRRGSSTLQAGHIPVAINGKHCICGNTDCVEVYAGGHTLREIAALAELDVETIFQLAQDTSTKQSLLQFIRYQAMLIATVITITEADMVLIGGGIPDMPGYPRDQLLIETRKHLRKPHPANTTKINWAQLGNTAPLHGALALVNQLSTLDLKDHGT